MTCEPGSLITLQYPLCIGWVALTVPGLSPGTWLGMIG